MYQRFGDRGHSPVPMERLPADRGRPRRGGDLRTGGWSGHRAALSPPHLSPGHAERGRVRWCV